MTKKIGQGVNEMRQWLADADAFNAKCEAEEYTDTGEAWELLEQIAQIAKRTLAELEEIEGKDDA